jgi:2,3-diketo-5-methylthio-1-phosphopentane phosphatase
MHNKTLIVFDLDQTITKVDSFCTITPLLVSPEETEEILKKCKTPGLNWIPIQNLMYEYSYKHGKDHLAIKKALETIELNNGMKELFNYLRENLEKYEILILSSGNTICIEYILTYNKLRDIIKEILTNPSIIDEKGLIKVSQKHEHNCKTCNACQCKKLELKEYFKINPKENYNKVIWVCDGKNDKCLCEILEKNDFVFTRKDFALYKELYENNFKDNIKCNIFPWNDGFEIINELKKLIKFK